MLCHWVFHCKTTPFGCSILSVFILSLQCAVCKKWIYKADFKTSRINFLFLKILCLFVYVFNHLLSLFVEAYSFSSLFSKQFSCKNVWRPISSISVMWLGGSFLDTDISFCHGITKIMNHHLQSLTFWIINIMQLLILLLLHHCDYYYYYEEEEENYYW